MAVANRVTPMPRKSALPPYFVWRNGRPRWNPGAGLRARGYRGQDLKDTSGAWLPKGKAIDAAEAINAQVAGKEPVVKQSGVRTLHDLFARYQQSQFFQKLAPRTRHDYADHMKILAAWGGPAPIAGISPDDVQTLYAELAKGRGLTRANAIMRTLRLTMNFGMEKLKPRWLDTNPAAKPQLNKAQGRTVIWSPAEIACFVAAADWCGRAGQGDAMILAVTTSWQRTDILVKPAMIQNDGVYRHARGKNGRMQYAPASAPLESRLAVMRARRGAQFPNVVFPTELVCTSTGNFYGSPYPANGFYFADEFRAVRALASGLLFSIEDAVRAMAGMPPMLRNLPFTPMPSLLDKQFADLRDTAITMFYDETKDIGRTATFSGHSLKTAQHIIDEHYYGRSPAQARDGAGSFDALLAKEA